MSCILAINPGSSSTKCGVVRDGEVILDVDAPNEPGEFDDCKTIADQAPLREAKILAVLKEHGVDMGGIDAISSRGVGLAPAEGGTYRINEKAVEDAAADVSQFNHPATTGIGIAWRLAQRLGVP